MLVNAASFPTFEFGVNCPKMVTVGARTCVSFEVDVVPVLLRIGTAPRFLMKFDGRKVPTGELIVIMASGPAAMRSERVA